MKRTTEEWLLAAEDDLLAARSLVDNDRLTNIAAFHCQQCIEKCFKAIMEERDIPFVKTHDLLRLHKLTRFSLDEEHMKILSIVNEVYLDARYPGEYGLMPNGKPGNKDLQEFIKLAEHVLHMVRNSSQNT